MTGSTTAAWKRLSTSATSRGDRLRRSVCVPVADDQVASRLVHAARRAQRARSGAGYGAERHLLSRPSRSSQVVLVHGGTGMPHPTTGVSTPVVRRVHAPPLTAQKSAPRQLAQAAPSAALQRAQWDLTACRRTIHAVDRSGPGSSSTCLSSGVPFDVCASPPGPPSSRSQRASAWPSGASAVLNTAHVEHGARPWSVWARRWRRRSERPPSASCSPPSSSCLRDRL